MSRFLRRVRHIIAGALASFLLAATALAQQPIASRLNWEYRTIAPQPVPPGNHIEVIEFFWYGCPYCYELEPALEAWLKHKPGDVAFRRIPAVFRPSWVPHAHVYYTLEALGEVDRLHRIVFDAYQHNELSTNDANAIADWAANHGIDRSRWLAAYHSEEVERNVRRARDLTLQYEVQGTPSLVVDGRYLTSTGMTPNVPAVIPVLNDLVLLARERISNTGPGAR